MEQENTFPIIAAQTGFDESFLIGTREELLNFANAIINAVENVHPDVFFGVPAETSNLIARKLDSLSEVRFDWLVVTSTSKEKEEIFYKIYSGVF